MAQTTLWHKEVRADTVKAWTGLIVRVVDYIILGSKAISYFYLILVLIFEQQFYYKHLLVDLKMCFL